MTITKGSNSERQINIEPVITGTSERLFNLPHQEHRIYLQVLLLPPMIWEEVLFVEQ